MTTPHSRQHRCSPSITNALSLWGLAAVTLVLTLACHAPHIAAACAR